jgi:hypothetical protein
MEFKRQLLIHICHVEMRQTNVILVDVHGHGTEESS